MPGRDAITSRLNGVLNDFFDVEALTAALVAACERPESFVSVRMVARGAGGPGRRKAPRFEDQAQGGTG